MRLIDADALKKAFYAESVFHAHIDNIIDDAPTIAAVPAVRGKWKDSVNDKRYACGFICSVCDSWASIHENYCPNCGAEMKGE